MKDLIITALNEANTILEKRVPQTNIEVKQVIIEDVNPLELVKFMKKNNIPDNAWFGGIDNGYDGFSDVCLNYDVILPTTEKEKLKFRQEKFKQIAFKPVHDILISNGYKRVGFNSGLLKQFSDTNVFDMFFNKEFDRLVEYYSLSFILA